jgi:hypothetical protein
MLETMAHIVPSQPNEAMARIASCKNLSAFNFRVGFNFRVEEDWARWGKTPPPPPVTTRQFALFSRALLRVEFYE